MPTGGFLLESHNIPYKIEHLHGSNLTDLTLDYARSVDADLISIMTEQEKSASNLLLGTLLINDKQSIYSGFIISKLSFTYKRRGYLVFRSI
jgi:hypothetical protein